MDAPQSTDAQATVSQPRASNPTKVRPPKRFYRGPPFLKSFPKFRKLPMELRAMIWELTLTPRVIEIEFQTERGFYTRVPTPVALKICQDSREAVKRLYPGCFGNNIYEPRILFNFAVDTLYLDSGVQDHTLLLLAGLKEAELKGLRFMAIDNMINEDFEIGDTTEHDTFELVKILLPRMPSMQSLQVVQSLEDWNGLSLPNGHGPMQLFEEWPDQLVYNHYCFEDLDSVDLANMTEEEMEELELECGCRDLPGLRSELRDIKVPTVDSIWGWRPLKQ